ncbi:DUF2642 domain-containing protein [Oceanobacillus sp. J11TS1]|uniref:DUF2642 domain-containing protein n=1 Tax=Oceanobacillus sp. J11TS1 TaxID=2807191 RepID=UPI001B203340|nr:DUF2642 domain-containing protein [Oceanobacillus sp. J11TS1]GIO21494.1 hypothetical protein J11TS1_00750 [Oceanobacillus sp. J11TS1]
MVNLTERQKKLIRLLNLLSQNAVNNALGTNDTNNTNNTNDANNTNTTNNTTTNDANTANIANILNPSNLNLDSSLSNSFSLDLLGLLRLAADFNLDLGIGNGGGGTPGNPGNPTKMREILQGLVNKPVQVTTPFDTISGTLLGVLEDYIVIIEETGSQVLVALDKIEFVGQ